MGSDLKGKSSPARRRPVRSLTELQGPTLGSESRDPISRANKMVGVLYINPRTADKAKRDGQGETSSLLFCLVIGVEIFSVRSVFTRSDSTRRKMKDKSRTQDRTKLAGKCQGDTVDIQRN